MSDIHDLAAQVVADSPAHRALAACEQVSRFIRHGQVDGMFGETLDSAYLLAVSQHTLPGGTPVYHAVFALVGTIVSMLLAEKDGGYVKLPPDAIFGSIGTVG